MKNKNPVDASLMSIFQAVVLGRIILAVIATMLHPLIPQWLVVVVLTMPLWDALVLAVPLSISWARRRMAQQFLPVVLVTATILPIIEQHLTIYTIQPDILGRAGLTWQLYVVLLIPLVITAGQYRFRAVMLFCFGTALLDLTIIQFLYGSAPDLFQGAGMITFFRTLSYLIIGYIVYRSVAVQRQKSEELAKANEQLARYAILNEELAISRERNRLARELHDTLSHTLSASSVQLEAIDTIWDINPEKARSMLCEVRQITRAGLTETRQALRDLRSTHVEDMGLSLAIHHIVEAIASRGSIKTMIELPDKLDVLDRLTQQCIYRIIQESMTNIVQHAEARHAIIKLTLKADELRLLIQDDGKGFDVNQVDQRIHFGITGMQERVKLIGGDLQIESVVGKGTTLRLHVEIDSEKPRHNGQTSELTDSTVRRIADMSPVASHNGNTG